MTTDIDLDALTALESATYPAPWTVEYDSYRNDERWVVKADCTPVAFYDEKEEALTLAGLRNAVPALLSALTATRAELETARAVALSNKAAHTTAFEECERLTALVARVRPVLEYVSRGRSFIGTDGPYPDAAARRVLAEVADAAPTAAPKPDGPGHCGLCGSEDCPGVPGQGCTPGPFETYQPEPWPLNVTCPLPLCAAPPRVWCTGIGDNVPGHVHDERRAKAAGAGDGEQPSGTDRIAAAAAKSARDNTAFHRGGLAGDGEQDTATRLPATCDKVDNGIPHPMHSWPQDGRRIVCLGRPAPASVQGAADGEAQA